MKTTAEKLADLRARLEKAQDPGSERARAKRDEAGFTTPRQRIQRLLDDGSFVEIGALGRTPDEKDAPYGDGVVTGYGRIDGRPVAIYAHDKTVYGGSVGVTFGRKVCEVMDMAIKIGCPVIGIQDSGGARIQDAVTSLAMYSEISRRQLPLSGRSPQISIMMGKSAGGAVYAPVTTDFVVAVDGRAELYVTGPAVIKEVTGEEISSHDLGSARQQELNGNVSYVAADEEDAFNYVHDLLQHLPLTCQDPNPEYWAPADEDLADDEALDSFMPDDTNAGYDMHDLLKRLFDSDDFLEVQPNFAPNLITGFARIDGKSVGVVANQPLEFAGCIDADAADKGARFIRICDAYNIPVLFVVDTPGYLPGVDQEKAGLIHRGAKLAFALVEATVPKISLIVRKAYGGAYAVMGSKNLTGDINLAWPTAQIAVMGAAAASVMIQGKQLAMIEDETQRAYMKKVFMDFYDENMTSPYVAAERGYVDAMIQPHETRIALRRAMRQLETKDVRDLPKKHTIMPM
ncbi:acyl-CoA carboxylase subunit beta [Corynebacterium pseudotuberculosis]|uniref:Methylmalonyl-CoA carboxyltransferase n=2 Tax=Corynebacterium pseudotuberculosis TaxID=1719 RepID=D9QCW9_CORP2|nr:acyl-CoA carboxylase subunit beta [Corynebacterium pseudotuberculosis]ADK29746.2 methylmalonyl-CoA carboxyltransferase [Corynebacterium pseudotuberculosis FRC41]ADL11395.1 methylmalonyl-CoA carboxyltransferase [Corynebacterium pseudotuberculosis C231]ADL21807.2 acyl-CoA carboxylase subunit beta [Corynebacterium pseudotuberculosis 1002]ADO27205.2 methylmalonyl-CoA carboxyltransferase [Corynebacterium pseudotuberculosis I19]AEQ07477.2 methylmalonyl-CoA carboxyltransferase [Corynebacterium pse